MLFDFYFLQPDQQIIRQGTVECILICFTFLCTFANTEKNDFRALRNSHAAKGIMTSSLPRDSHYFHVTNISSQSG